MPSALDRKSNTMLSSLAGLPEKFGLRSTVKPAGASYVTRRKGPEPTTAPYAGLVQSAGVGSPSRSTLFLRTADRISRAAIWLKYGIGLTRCTRNVLSSTASTPSDVGGSDPREISAALTIIPSRKL